MDASLWHGPFLLSGPGATVYPTTLIALELQAHHSVAYVTHLCAMILVSN